MVHNYSLPGLKHIGEALSLDGLLAKGREDRMGQARVLETGHIVVWTGEHEFGVCYQWGKGVRLAAEPARVDTLYNPNTPPLPRPTISNLQWLAGTQHVSIEDLDILVGGPGRPTSWKQQQAQRTAAASEKEAKRETLRREETEASESSAGGSVFANMAKNMKERSDKLSFTTDTMDRLEESSANFAQDVDKYISKQKKKAMLGMFGKFLP